MNTKFQILLLSLVVLLFAGCATTGNVVQETDAVAQTQLKSLDVLDHSDDDTAVDYNEVELYLTNGGFSPAVIEANVGQTIVVTSYYVNDVHFSIDELAVEEMLDEAESFEFVVEKAGEFPFICVDCSPMLKGILVVE